MVERDDDRRRNEHAPVAVEREERERAEDVEVRFDAAAGQMDQQRAHQHLRHGHGVPRRREARAEQREQRRRKADDAADDDGGPHVQVRAADGPYHASGDTHSAKTMPAIHWNAISPANNRSVRR